MSVACIEAVTGITNDRSINNRSTSQYIADDLQSVLLEWCFFLVSRGLENVGLDQS
jgi:hypothetical protein